MSSAHRIKTYKFLLFLLAWVYVFFTFFWLYLNYLQLVDTPFNYLFGLFFAFLPLLGSLCGFYISTRWGSLSSKIGKFVFFMSLGLLFWSLGNMIFSYYDLLLGEPVPYPSVADYLYIGQALAYTSGVLYMIKSISPDSRFKKVGTKAYMLFIPVVMFSLTLYNMYSEGILSPDLGLSISYVLDIFYPLSSVLLMTLVILAILLSYNYLGGKYRFAIYMLLFGIFIEYLGDIGFTKTINNDTYYVGNWVDMLFITGIFIVSISLVFLSPSRLEELHNGK